MTNFLNWNYDVFHNLLNRSKCNTNLFCYFSCTNNKIFYCKEFYFLTRTILTDERKQVLFWYKMWRNDYQTLHLIHCRGWSFHWCTMLFPLFLDTLFCSSIFQLVFRKQKEKEVHVSFLLNKYSVNLFTFKRWKQKNTSNYYITRGIRH